MTADGEVVTLMEGEAEEQIVADINGWKWSLQRSRPQILCARGAPGQMRSELGSFFSLIESNFFFFQGRICV